MPYAALAVLAAVLVIGFVLRRRAAVGKHVRVLADVIVGIRAVAGASSSRRPAPPDHAKLLQHAEHFATAARELESLGCTILGDLEELKADGSSAGALRWFIDRSGTICGWFAVIASKTRPVPVMLIHSELTPLKFLLSQHGGAELALARAPTSPRFYYATTVPLQTVFDQHRAHLTAMAPAVPQVIADLADAEAMFDRGRAHLQQWRAAQDPEALIALDVESVLRVREGAYEAFGYKVFALLCARMAQENGASGSMA